MAGEAARKTKTEKDPEASTTISFPDATQQVMAGLKPKAIEDVEAQFRKALKLKAEKAKIDGALKDQKERLYETMKENNVPSYGLREGKVRWIADISEEPKLVLKKAKNDRD